MRAFVAALVLAASGSVAQAQACAPFEDRVGVFGEWLEVDVVNSVGPIGVWACYRIVENAWRPTSVHCAESTWAELGAKPFANLGARADTIRKAADPVAAFHASRKRFTTRASPRCTAALAQYKARP